MERDTMNDKDTVWEKIHHGLRDAATLSIEKIDEYAKIGKLKFEEMVARRKVERNCVDIGLRVFELVEDKKPVDTVKDISISKACDNIRCLKKELSDIADKIKKISEEAKASRKDRTKEDEPIGI